MSQKELTLLTTYSEDRCPDYIYYNAIYTNDTGAVAPIAVNDRRSSTLVDEGLRYRYTGSLKRFLIDSFLIPLTYVSDLPSFVVTIQIGATSVSVPLVYIPSSTALQSELQSAIFTVDQWVSCLNATLLLAYTTALGSGLTASFSPFFIYDGKGIKLVIDPDKYQPSNPAGAKLFVSNQIFTRLGGNLNYLYTPGDSPRDAQILVKSLGDNFFPAGTFFDTALPPTPIPFSSLVMPIATDALSPLATIKQILIQAVSTAIRSQAYGTNIQRSTPPNLALQTIEDFVYVPEGRGQILYQPQIERPFNLLSDQPISQFSFNILYMDSDLQTYQALCIPGSSSIFKFGFTKTYSENNVGILMTIYRLLERVAPSAGVVNVGGRK